LGAKARLGLEPGHRRGEGSAADAGGDAGAELLESGPKEPGRGLPRV